MAGLKTTAFRILVIDDDQFSRRILVKLLDLIGAAHIVIASGFAEAVAALNADPTLKLIICDHYMPDGHGIKLLGDIRQGRLSVANDIYFIISTSSKSFALASVAMAFDVDSFMSKPFSKEELAKRLFGFLTDTKRTIKDPAYYLEKDVDGMLDAAESFDPHAQKVKGSADSSGALTPLESVKPGTVLAKDLVDAQGSVLLQRGTVLSSHIIERIQELGVKAVPV